MRHIAFCVAAVAAGLFVSTAARAQQFVNTGFEEGTFAATGLNDFSAITAPTLTGTAGTGGSTALDFASDGAAASAEEAAVHIVPDSEIY